MRLIPLILSSLTLFSACSHYQYNTISSSHLHLNDKMELVAENDTMRIEYNFNGRNAPVYLSFENKLDVPLFIDWQRSALIVGKSSFSYAPGRALLQADVNSLGVTPSNAVTTTTHTINGSIVLPETMEFIPPHSRISKGHMELPGRKIGKSPNSVTHRVPISMGSKTRYVKLANFTEDNSPLKFRSYITYMVGEPNARPVAYEHHFYVSESMSTNLNTLYFKHRIQDGNRYFTVSSSGAGPVIGLLLVSTCAVALAAGGVHSPDPQ